MIDDALRLLDMPRTSEATQNHEVMVLGLGNILLGDDGVGVHVVQRLTIHPDAPRGMELIDGGTLGFRLMDLLARASAVILVDAAQLGEHAGAIRLFEHVALDRYVQRGSRLSAHEAGLVDIMTLMKLDGCAPARLALIGIQPQNVDWDAGLSPAVADALHSACRTAIDLALQWQRAA